MFDLKKVLSELNITEEYFMDKLGISASYFTEVINKENPEKQFCTRISSYKTET